MPPTTVFITKTFLCALGAVSRAFGDRLLKPYVVADPDIQEEDLSSEDHSLVLATDGVWDVISNQDAISLIRVSYSGFPAPGTQSLTLGGVWDVSCDQDAISLIESLT